MNLLFKTLNYFEEEKTTDLFFSSKSRKNYVRKTFLKIYMGLNWR